MFFFSLAPRVSGRLHHTSALAGFRRNPQMHLGMASRSSLDIRARASGTSIQRPTPQKKLLLLRFLLLGY